MARRQKKRFVPETGQVTALSHEGRGIAERDGKKVFIAGALPSETVEFQVTRRRKNLDEAKLLGVVEPASNRIDPGCPVFGVCGGCSLQHLSGADQLVHKQQVLRDVLSRIGHVEVPLLAPVVAGPIWNYRRRARLGVKQVAGKGRVLVGFRERHAPYIADMLDCRVLDERLASLPATLSELIGGLSIAARVPQIELAAGDNGAALVFRVLDAPTSDDIKSLSDFGTNHDFRIYLQTGGMNTIAELEPASAQALCYSLPKYDVRYEFGPADFVQINAGVNEALVDRALEWLAPVETSRILDLYCGLGNFSLPLARTAAAVVGVEGASELVELARHNAANNGIENAQFFAADLANLSGDEVWLNEKYDGVLLDPARVGAEPMLCAIAAMEPERIVYVSCNPATLARDLGILVNTFGYVLTDAGIADMFPHTAHVESIVALRRGKT